MTSGVHILSIRSVWR